MGVKIEKDAKTWNLYSEMTNINKKVQQMLLDV